MQTDVIKEDLEREFGLKATIQEKTVKITVPQIKGSELMGLADIYTHRGVKDLKLKRSGTSITVLVEV